MDKSIDYHCNNCDKDIEINFTIYSMDEFFCDESCPECNAKIPQSVLDKIYNDEPIDYISSKIDYATDMMGDR